MDANSKRVTKEQKFFLVQYLEEHRDFAHDRFVNDAGVKSLREQWDVLAASLNACGGAVKDGESWKRAWVNMRSKTKQKFQEIKSSLEATGNNSVSEKILSDLDERIIGVMSRVAVEGQVEVSEPMRASGAVSSVNILSQSSDFLDVEFLDDDVAGPSNVILQEPQRPRASKKRSDAIPERQLSILKEILSETKITNEIQRERNEIERERNEIERQRNEIERQRNEIERERNEIERKKMK